MRADQQRRMDESEGLTLIRTPGRWPGFGFGELYRYRSVAWKLALRNLKARYRQTLLGVAWVLLQPLAMMVILSFFFGLIARQGYMDIPFPVWFITGLSIWGPALKVLNEGTQSLTANQQLVTRVYLPRPLVPLSVALAALIDLGFTLIAAQVILLLWGYTPSLAYLTLPFLIIVAFATTLGMAYFLSAVNVAYRDIQSALPFMERLWFFLGPLLYPVQLVPEHLWPIYFLNPMSLVLSGFRWALAGAPAVPWWAWIEGSAVAVLMLVGGFIYFRMREPSFADVL